MILHETLTLLLRLSLTDPMNFSHFVLSFLFPVSLVSCLLSRPLLLLCPTSIHILINTLLPVARSSMLSCVRSTLQKCPLPLFLAICRPGSMLLSPFITPVLLFPSLASLSQRRKTPTAPLLGTMRIFLGLMVFSSSCSMMAAHISMVPYRLLPLRTSFCIPILLIFPLVSSRSVAASLTLSLMTPPFRR